MVVCSMYGANLQGHTTARTNASTWDKKHNLGHYSTQYKLTDLELL